jgi:hypothetical protein
VKHPENPGFTNLHQTNKIQPTLLAMRIYKINLKHLEILRHVIGTQRGVSLPTRLMAPLQRDIQKGIKQMSLGNHKDTQLLQWMAFLQNQQR